jgi:TPR repeat protein
MRSLDRGNLVYTYGRGVPQDYVRAHMWLNSSAAQGNQKAAEDRDNVARRMTSAQIAEGQTLAREWRPAP